MIPSLGRTVLYKLTAQDAEQINRRRTDGKSIRERIELNNWHPGAQAHIGNEAKEGAEVPAVIVAVWKQGNAAGETTAVNLHCFLDGNDAFWATSRQQGTQAGNWRDPNPPKPTAKSEPAKTEEKPKTE